MNHGGLGLAVVTGASSGIGKAFAERLAADGHPLLLVARREERLRDIAADLSARYGIDVEVAVADLGAPEGWAACRDAIDAIGGAPDVVVLNAGVGAMGTVAGIGRERQGAMVALNCGSVVDLACHVLPGMVGRGSGRVIIVSSAAAWQPVPYMATYGATKAFELSFADALAVELAGTGVRSIAVCPGPTSTEFSAAAGSSYGLRWLPRETPEGVVEATMRAIERGRPRVATGWLARVSTVAASVLPRRLVIWGSGVAHRRFRPHGAD